MSGTRHFPRLTRSHRSTMLGVDKVKLEAEGAIVLPFIQAKELPPECSEGLCWAFNASLMRKLYAGDFQAATQYTNPLPQPILEDVKSLNLRSIQMIKARREHDVDKIPFCGRRPKKVTVPTEELSPYLGAHTKGAILTYATKKGTNHSLLFCNIGGKAVVQDANQYTIVGAPIASAKQALKVTIERSDPPEVVVTFDPFRRSAL